MVVADRAMMSEKNIMMMEKENYGYVIAAKLKQLPKFLKEKILKRTQEDTIKIEGESVYIQEYIYNGRRLIVSYSENRAIKNKHDRECLIKKMQEKTRNKEVETKKLITNRGYLKFVDEKGKSKVILNEEKINKEAQWDGLHGVLTSDKESNAVEILGRYKNLWRIEESFRLNKHFLAMRPIYHYKENRIRAHVLICYLAFALSRYVQILLKTSGNSMSLESIRRELMKVESSIVEDENNQLYKLPSKLTKQGREIYQSIGKKRIEKTVKIAS